MKKIIVLFTILFVVFHAFAQEKISGYVEDSLTHNRLTNVSVTLLRNGKPLKFTRSKGDGTFLIPIAQKQTGDMLQASYMGYKKQKTAVSSGKETIISMASTAFVLKEVQVKGSRITGRDTISFDLTRFANERDNSLKDVLKKLPGVDIEKNGRINYNGKPINRFTVEGLDLTGGKYNQLEENIKAKDVKKAEVIEHDQPIKALQNKTFTDNVAMNIALKDSARDKLMPTLKPYMLVGHPSHIGGSINIMQIGKKKQMMYDAEYDRTGKNLGYTLNQLASYSNRLAPASLPSWISVPSLDAPIDEERLRFNTSQKYSINHIKKNKDDAETRIEANYLRTVIRQERENMSIYDLGGEANPRRINHEQLRILARNAKGGITHIYLHWTAGTYEQVFDDYHINIGEQGELYLTCNMLREYKSHTWRRNSRSIGVTLCCAKDAILAYKCNPVFGAYPPTMLQVEQMAIVVAILCHELELEINNDTVMTHAEAASRDQYGPGQGDPDMRWDLYMLKGMPETRVLRPGGVLLRKKALAYLHSMLRDKLLQPHEAEVEQPELLAA